VIILPRFSAFYTSADVFSVRNIVMFPESMFAEFPPDPVIDLFYQHVLTSLYRCNFLKMSTKIPLTPKN